MHVGDEGGARAGEAGRLGSWLDVTAGDGHSAPGVALLPPTRDHPRRPRCVCCAQCRFFFFVLWGRVTALVF